MAQLNVEPKKSSPWWLWLLLALIALALLFFLTKGCNNKSDGLTNSDTTASTSTSVDPLTDDWNTIDRTAPAAAYDEITDKDIEVRGNNNYAIYGLEETLLFDTDKNTIRKGAEEKLKQVAASAEKRFANGEVRIYGYTDSTGTASHNKQLAEERANAVRTWLVTSGKIPLDHTSVNPVGEADPTATNATASGRQQNRRVEIIVRKSK